METLDPYNDTANEQQQQEQLNSSDDVESLTSEKIYTYDYANQEDGNNGGQFSELGSESGVEPDYTEWVFDEKAVVEDEFDITNEQALATLKFFSSSADRTNMMTKYHGADLDVVSQLLLEKEKDLDVAAKIGQSLLQRNKQLLIKIENMEEYLTETKDNEMQLEHDLKHKNELARIYFEEDIQSCNSSNSKECEDEGFRSLTNRCRALERENQELFSEALNVRQYTNEFEEKEEGLVLDCIEQLSTAKQQITDLTDEIAQKFEDNVQQQEEITQLINMVVELQKRQKQLCTDNEDLQGQLFEAENDKDSLKEQLLMMQSKFRETYDMLRENQEEVKHLRDRLETGPPTNPSDWLNDSANSLAIQDSLANEIEESVRRGLIHTEERRKQARKVMDNVRLLNTKSSSLHTGTIAGSSIASTSGRTSPVSNWSLASDERSDTMSNFSTVEQENTRTKKNVKKLQIVKPMEGSDTLSKWQNLASQNVKDGFNVSDVSPTKETVVGDFTTTDESSANEDTPTNNDSVTTIPGTPNGKRPTIRKPLKPHKQSTPATTESKDEKPITTGNSFLKGLETPKNTKRTILTRNSSAMNSIRAGRKMLRSTEKNGRSKTEVIDMIASAMNKANVEAKAGQRILSSLSNSVSSTPRRESIRQRAETLTKSPELLQEMPNVTKVLEKVTQNINALGLTSSDLDSEIDDAPPPSYTPPRVVEELNSVTGPLGLLNRADVNEPNPMLRNRLMRMSSVDKANESAELGLSGSTTNSNLGVRRNKSSGSLVDMMVSGKLNSGFRPMGLANLMNTGIAGTTTTTEPNSAGLLGLVNNAAISSSTGRLATTTETPPSDVATKKASSRSVETGLDNVRTSENNNSTGGFGFFSSFLGKLS